MIPLWAIAKRELLSLWVTPLAWLLLFVFTLLNGAAFITVITALSDTTASFLDLGPVQAFYGQSVFVPLGYLVFCPILAMRSLAEERRQGTAETLLSTRATSTMIVLGKYLALAVTYVTLWVPTLLYPWILRQTGHIEGTVVASSYLGVLSMGLGFLAVGVLTSALSTNQLISAALCGAFILLYLLCGVGAQLFAGTRLYDVFYYLSVQAHLTEFAQGIISRGRLLHSLTLITLPLFLAVRAVENWRDA